ncbi:MAG: hypothetical protein HQM14_01505 [SAR324 cluster bacterium]|nr:hypothetical protein [SAR324 cluster bacterium]
MNKHSQQNTNSNTSNEISEYRDLLDFLKEHEGRLREILDARIVSHDNSHALLNAPTEKGKHLTIQIDESTLQRLEDTTSLLKISKNQFINAAILSMLEHYEKHRKESEEESQFDSLVEQSTNQEYTQEEQQIKDYVGQDDFIDTLRNWRKFDLK